MLVVMGEAPRHHDRPSPADPVRRAFHPSGIYESRVAARKFPGPRWRNTPRRLEATLVLPPPCYFQRNRTAITNGRCNVVWDERGEVFGGQRRRRSKVARFRIDHRSVRTRAPISHPHSFEKYKDIHRCGRVGKLSTRGEAAAVGGDEEATPPLACSSTAAPARRAFRSSGNEQSTGLRRNSDEWRKP